METQNIIKHSDPVRHDDLRDLARQSGPAASFMIPTHRGGPETLSDSQQLRPLLETARAELMERYPDVDAEALLAPVEALADSRRFWQEQCDGLAVFVSPGNSRYFRVDINFTPQVTVGEHHNLRPILPLVADDQEFLLAAISQGSVRLFAADRATITELALGDIPESADDVEGVDTREPQLQHQYAPGRAGPAHGHGPRDYNVLNGFLQAVGKALDNRFSTDSRPLIIASVDEYHGRLKDQLNRVQLLGHPVAGNPEALSAAQLHEAAWPLAAEEAAKRHVDLLDSFGEALGTGLASADPEDIVRNAETGRVETLILAERVLTAPSRPEDLDAALSATLLNSGRMDVVEELPGGHSAGAIYRY